MVNPSFPLVVYQVIKQMRMAKSELVRGPVVIDWKRREKLRHIHCTRTEALVSIPGLSKHNCVYGCWIRFHHHWGRQEFGSCSLLPFGSSEDFCLLFYDFVHLVHSRCSLPSTYLLIIQVLSNLRKLSHFQFPWALVPFGSEQVLG